jgi:hypothetical protein
MDMKNELWMVYGPAIKNFLSPDWSGKGHHYLYPFIKPRELWINSNTYEEEIAPLYTRLAISKFLVRDMKMPTSVGEVVGKVYQLKLISSYLREGSNFQSFFPKKSGLILPPVGQNYFSGAVEDTISYLHSNEDVTGDAWENIFSELNAAIPNHPSTL